MAKEAPKSKKGGDKKGGKTSVKDRKDAGPVGFAKIQKYNNMRLPDGTHKRKLDKIKATLIQKAKTKQQYAKLLAKEKKAQEQEQRPEHLGPAPVPVENQEDDSVPAEMHPDRQTRIDEMEGQPDEPQKRQRERRERPPRPQRKSNPGFAAEQKKAEQRKKEAEEREKEIQEKEKAKRISIQERNRKKKLMTAKTVDGRKMLGKQSSVLLSKIQQQMST
ncbi:hypothetical protein BJ508DRAFT_411609 [Ascobolus immersus RN42]|uniref:rRNA-processing protein FYV7 n=1 Tax=Ascobolus immersus RN42 TaxID=1160509 RepID=A0A3N4IIP5_ASCIM|nr:hypothetical protein BJ508DRAFT_411609 [Ascobolus immersus RN42]